MINVRSLAIRRLDEIIGYPLIYTIKSPDMDLCNFGFGFAGEYPSAKHDSTYVRPIFAIHSVCLVSLQDKRTGITEHIFEDTPHTVFGNTFHNVLGGIVKRVAITKRGNLSVELESHIIKFTATYIDEENWRFFRLESPEKHIVEIGRRIYFL